MCVVQFVVPGAKNGGSDKGPDGNRIDSIPIANGVIAAGGACDVLTYRDTQHAQFAKAILNYDALIVRIPPGQLSSSPQTLPGTQVRFDNAVGAFARKGGVVWDMALGGSASEEVWSGAKTVDLIKKAKGI